MNFIFMMWDLTLMYTDKLNSMKYYDFGKYHSSRLQETIEVPFPQRILTITESRYQHVWVKLISTTYAERINYDGGVSACKEYLRYSLDV